MFKTSSERGKPLVHYLYEKHITVSNEMCCDLTDCWQRLSLSRVKVEFTVIISSWKRAVIQKGGERDSG